MTKYMHVINGQNIRQVVIVEMRGEVALVKGLNGKMAGIPYEVPMPNLVEL